MPNLPLAADPIRMAGVLLGLEDNPSKMLAASRHIDIERVRYTPEVGAILRYSFDQTSVPTKIYGKVQPGNRGLRTYQIVQGLWRAAAH